MKRKASFELGLFAEDRARLEADIAELIGSAGDPHDLGSRVRDLVARHTGDSLQHYQRRLALAQSAGAVGCFEIDMTTGASAGTAAFFSNYGKPPDTGSWSHDEWFAHVHPDDRGRVSEQLRRVLATGREEELEYRIVRTDGAVVWVLTRTHLEHDASGRVTRAYGTQQDITRRKLTELALADREAQLTTVFGQAMVGIIHRSADGALIDVNGRFCEMMGRSREELETLTWRDLAHPDDVPATHAEYQMHLASGAPFVSEKRYVRPDGTVIWGKTQVTAVLGPDGSIASVVAIVDDVTERKLAELALAESEEHHRNFVEVNPGLFWTATPNGRITIVNSIGAEMLGMPHDVEEAGGVPQLVHPDDVERVRGEWGHALATGEPFRSEHRLRMADGNYRWMQIQASPRHDAEGAILRWYGATRDIHDRRMAEDALRREGERLTLALQGMRGWAYDWDVPGDRFWYTDGWQEVLGLADDKLLGTTRDFGRLVHVDDQERALAAISAHLAGKGPAFEAEYRVRTGDGSWRWLLDRGRVIARDHRGRPLRAVGIRTDITERKTAEELTTWRAGHDTLTGLANRALFQAELECALEGAARTGGIVGVLMLDLDRFKQVNDTYGHDVGDELLRMVADRLQRATRGSDVVARLGGDEFAVILPTLGTRGSIARPAEAIMAALKRPFLHQGRELDSRASVGVTLYPDDGATAGELLKNADMALYEAKARGRGCCVAYRPGMRRSLEKHVRIAQAARDALSKNRVGAYYQPKVCLKSGRVVGFEALLRWRGPDGRLRAPSSLASAFADQHLAGALGDRMLKTIIDDMRRWQDQGVDFGHVALNTAESELGDENFADKVLRRLADAGLDPRCLEIEVTENVFIGRAAERVRGNLEAFEAAGVGIALDDFGTGYASLTHLKSYPVSTLKVDRSFVRDIESDRGDAAIVRAVIALGRSLGKVVVAEGVETEAQAAFLRAEGCPLAQGFLYAPALAAGRVPRLAGTYLHPVEAKPLAA